MTLLQAIIFGIVQGLTEFLPISSTAHLAIVPALLGWQDPGAAFTAVIQIGTLAAVLTYFRGDIARITRATLDDLFRGRLLESLDARLGWMIAAGTMPIVLFGIVFASYIEGPARGLYVIATSLVVLALLLAWAEQRMLRRHRAGITLKDLAHVNWTDAIVIGLAQALALVPGSSRSGVTITAGLFRGLSRDTAARFSFLLSLPSVFAAAVYELVKERDVLLASWNDATNLIAATLTAALVGYAAIAFLLKYLKTHTTWLFIVYRLALGALLFAFLAAGWISD